MNITNFFLKQPFVLLCLVLLLAFNGIKAYYTIPGDLFPDTVPPQIIVITIWPGSSSNAVSDRVTEVLEKEFNSLSGKTKISSTSRNEVSSINIEFNYDKSIETGASEVQNAIGRIRSKLPAEIMEPRIFQVSYNTRPLMTLSVRPKSNSSIELHQIRQLAENTLQEELMNIKGVGECDFFGGNKPEIAVLLNKNALITKEINPLEIINALKNRNVYAPAGVFQNNENEFILVTNTEFKNLHEIENFTFRTSKGVIKLSDVAKVHIQPEKKKSLYRGNLFDSIGINILGTKESSAKDVIENVKKKLPKLKEKYPSLIFDITEDQQDLIDLNVQGMKDSLIQAVVITAGVILFFLIDAKASLIVGISIPLAFAVSLVILSFSSFTLNMVTLSGLIISVGMVVDSSVVVLENIYRRLETTNEDPLTASIKGTSEISLEISAGMFTTIAVLIPVMFTTGYTGRIMKPLNLMIISTLLASLIIALTIIPLLVSKIYKKSSKPSIIKRFFNFIVNKPIEFIGSIYAHVLKIALKIKFLIIILSVALFIFTVKTVVPLLGGELMPPMDTGISNIDFEVPSDYSSLKAHEKLREIEKIISKNPHIRKMSSTMGSEPGEISFGAGGSIAQSGRVTVYLNYRNQRNESIWEIQENWRKEIGQIKGIKSFQIREYGATPSSSTRAPLDIMISGKDQYVLMNLAKECRKALDGIQGLTDIRETWQIDKSEKNISLIPFGETRYGLSNLQLASSIRLAIDGISAGMFSVENETDIPIKVLYSKDFSSSLSDIMNIPIFTQTGIIPLHILGKMEHTIKAPFITRENLVNTINITGSNSILTIKQVVSEVEEKIKTVKVPEGYSITVQGSIQDMKRSQMTLLNALLIGMVFLYFLLAMMFNSFIHPVTVLSAIPLSLAGAFWGLLLFNKPLCQPAMMGIILLGGTIVNNSILLLGFIIESRKQGHDMEYALINSVKLRLKPILMTTVSTVLGLTPLILEQAIGLERMSPLGVAAASGLIAGTVFTLIITPVVYSIFEDLKGFFNFSKA